MITLLGVAATVLALLSVSAVLALNPTDSLRHLRGH